MGNNKKKTIQDQLYVFSSKDLPAKMLSIMLEYISGYDEKYSDELGRFGVMGVLAKDEGKEPGDLLNYRKCLQVGTERFKRILAKIRFEFPSMKVDEWYRLVMACYAEGDFVMDAILKDKPKTWSEYVLKHGYGSDFANNVWKAFEVKGGSIT